MPSASFAHRQRVYGAPASRKRVYQEVPPRSGPFLETIGSKTPTSSANSPRRTTTRASRYGRWSLCRTTAGVFPSVAENSACRRALSSHAGKLACALTSTESRGCSMSGLSPRPRPDTGILRPPRMAAIRRSACFQSRTARRLPALAPWHPATSGPPFPAAAPCRQAPGLHNRPRFHFSWFPEFVDNRRFMQLPC